MTTLTPEDLREYFDYNPLTGQLFRRKGRANELHKPAGCVRERGYIKISFKNKSYLAHRLIWLWIHGSFSNECIDHINGDTSDNSINNLRCVSLSANQNNQYRNRDDTKNCG